MILLEKSFFKITPFNVIISRNEDFFIMNKKIAVAGTGYVGLSIATLLSQFNEVTAVDIVPEKVDIINNKKSPIHILHLEYRVLMN